MSKQKTNYPAMPYQFEYRLEGEDWIRSSFQFPTVQEVERAAQLFMEVMKNKGLACVTRIINKTTGCVA